MPAVLIAVLFWSAVVAVVVAQVMILRSTMRVLRAAAPERPAFEWGFAVGPAIVLAIVLTLSWRATMRPPTIEVDLPALPGEVRS
jgi:cytochrome b561